MSSPLSKASVVIAAFASIAAVTLFVSAGPASASDISGRLYDGRPLETPEGRNIVIPSGLTPVAGAHVSFPELLLETTTDTNGVFSLPGINTPTPCMEVTVEVTAPGFGRWRLLGATVYPESGLGITAILKTNPQTERGTRGRNQPSCVLPETGYLPQPWLIILGIIFLVFGVRLAFRKF